MIIDIFLLIWLHWIADFVLQSDSMATKKSTSNAWLSWHIFVYSVPFLYFGFWFALVNGLLHWIVDYFTSRANKKLWADDETHYFFVMVGFDQALHLTSLFTTYYYMIM